MNLFSSVLLLLSLVINIPVANAADSPTHYPVVKLSDFRVGKYWVWVYFEQNKTTQKWETPYLYERYSVIEVEGSIVTIEMSSGPRLPVLTPAHHKFRVDIKTCLKNYGQLENLKNWTVEFYTKSLSPDWELTSKFHKNLVFSEKFNCTATSSQSTVFTVNTELGVLSAFKHNVLGWDSYYGLDNPALRGVAVLKYFDSHYKFELIEMNP
jgi:hypothetical protein